jgi:hypothetical protein
MTDFLRRGSAPNDHANADSWYDATGKINGFVADQLALNSRIISAGERRFEGGATTEARIALADAQCVLELAPILYIPAFMLPYDITLCPASASVKRIREGGTSDHYDVQAYGAAGDGVQDDTNGVRAALTVVMAAVSPTIGGIVYFPEGRYRITAKLLIDSGQRIQLLGAGRAAAILMNEVVGSPADPMIELTSPSAYYLIQGLGIDGNNLTGAAGNGHAIALINRQAGAGSTTFFPQQVMIRDCTIQFHQGTGKDSTGASIPACAVYGFGGTGDYLSNTFSYTNKTGYRFDLMSKVYLTQCSVDVASECAVRIENGSDAIGMVGCILNGSGAGGAQQGLLYVRTSTNISFAGGRLKNGYPYLVNVASDGSYADGISIRDSSCQQYDVAGGHTAFAIGNGVRGCTIDGNVIEFVGTITDAVGVLTTQCITGHSLTGLRITGNGFHTGSGGTIAACVRLNTTSNTVLGALIESNTFGTYENIAQTITYGLDIPSGSKQDGTTIRHNVFVAATGITISNCIRHWGTGTVYIGPNIYHAFGGTITNEVNADTFLYVRTDAGYTSGYEIADPAAADTNMGRLYFKDNGSGKTQIVVKFKTGAVQVIATEP